MIVAIDGPAGVGKSSIAKMVGQKLGLYYLNSGNFYRGVTYRVLHKGIDPTDKDLCIKAAKEAGAIVTAEEHSIIGGLGGAVAEVLSESCPVPVLRLGVEDTFGRSGPAVKLLHLFGLDAEHIAAKAKKAVSLKK